MHERLTVACAQVEPVVLDQAATLDKLEGRVVGEAAGAGAEALSSSRKCSWTLRIRRRSWAKFLAGWEDKEGRKAAFAMLAREAVGRGSRPRGSEHLAEIARAHGVWLVVGVDEIERHRPRGRSTTRSSTTARTASSLSSIAS